MTSYAVVRKVKNLLGVEKAGHFGSLDPIATGLLIIALGKATKLFSFYVEKNKTYHGKIRLGFSTTTYDREGEPTSEEKEVKFKEEEIVKALKKFEGEFEQIPPPYSAKKYKGKPLYKYARQGRKLILKPKEVKIISLKLVNYLPPFLEFETECSAGTYIRSLAHDLGEYLDVGAHLYSLERTKIGEFSISQSLSLEEVKFMKEKNKIEEKIIPLEMLLPQFPKVILEEKGAKLALNGNVVTLDSVLKILGKKNNIFRLFNVEGRFLALAIRAQKKQGFQPILVFK